MNLLIDGQSLLSPQTGIGLVTQELILYLDSCEEVGKIGCYFSVFPFGGKWGAAKSKIQSLGFSSKIEIHRIPFPLGVLLSLWNRFSIPKMEWMARGFDIIHGPSHVLPARRRLPGVLTVQDVSLLDNPQWYPPSAAAIRARLAKGIREADRIIVPSRYVKDSILSRYRSNPDSIDVISNPFHGVYHLFSMEEKINHRQTIYGTSDPYILWIGEINPRKNVGVLPRILSTLREKKREKIRLVMIGPPGYCADVFFREAQSLGLTVVSLQDFLMGKQGDILFTGYLSDEDRKKRWLAAAECLIFPSLDEGFGYPILEAMASGTPAIFPKAGALPEIAGDAGICVSSPNSIHEYVSAALDLFDNPDLYRRQVELGLNRKTFFEKQDLYPYVETYQKAIQERSMAKIK